MSPCGFAALVIALMSSSADGGDTYPFDLPSLRAGVNREGEQESWRTQCSFQSDLSSLYLPQKHPENLFSMPGKALPADVVY